MKIGVFPGTFDPITNGHLDIIKRASAMFDEIIVGIFVNPQKSTFFSVEERVEYVKRATSDIINVKVEQFSGLLIDFMHLHNSNIIIRGLRAVSDFEYEFQRALANRKQDKDVETIFMIPRSKYLYISSSILKEIACFGGNIDDIVPDVIKADVANRLLIKEK